MAKAKEKHFHAWSNVPDGSTLFVSAKGTTSKKLLLVTVDGLEIPPEGPAKLIVGILDSVAGKPMPIPLTSPNIYAIDINLHFMTAAVAVVHAHIEGPDGALFDVPFDTKISRKKGAVETVVLSIGMRPGRR